MCSFLEHGVKKWLSVTCFWEFLRKYVKSKRTSKREGSKSSSRLLVFRGFLGARLLLVYLPFTSAFRANRVFPSLVYSPFTRSVLWPHPFGLLLAPLYRGR